MKRLIRNILVLAVLLIALGITASRPGVQAVAPCCQQCEGGYDLCVEGCSQGDTACLNNCESRWHGLCYTYCRPDPTCDCDANPEMCIQY